MSQTAGGAGLTRQASKSKIPLPKSHGKAGDDTALSAIANGVPSKLKKRGGSMPPAFDPEDHHDLSGNGVHKDEQVVGVAAPIIEAAVEADVDVPQPSPAVQLFPQTPAKLQANQNHVLETPAPSSDLGAGVATPLGASLSTPSSQPFMSEFSTPGPRAIPTAEFQNIIAAMSPQPPQTIDSPQRPNSPSANSSSIEPSVSALSTPSNQSDAVSEEEEIDFGDDDVVVHTDVAPSVPEYVAFMKKPEDKEVKQSLAAHAEGPENYDEFPDTELQLVTPSKGDSLSSHITPSPLGTRTVTSSEFRQLSSRMQRTPSNTDSASPMTFSLPSTVAMDFVEIVDPIFVFNAFPSKPLILDVRSSEEYEAGHLPVSWNAPIAPSENDISLDSLVACMSPADQKAFKPLVTNISRKNNLTTGSNRIDLPTLFVYDDASANNENSLAFRVAKSLSSASCRTAVLKGGVNAFLSQYPDLRCQEQAKLRRTHKISCMFWSYPTEIIPQRLYLGPWMPACPLQNTVTDVVAIELPGAKPKSNPFGVDLEKLRPDVRVHPVQIDEPKSEDDAASMLGAIKVLNKALSNPAAKVVVVDQLGGNNLAAACVTMFLMDNQRIPLTQALGFVTRHRSSALSSDFNKHPESPPAYVLLGEAEYRLFSTGTLADVADTAPLMKAYPQKRRLWEVIDPSGYAAAHNMETNVEDNKNIKSPDVTPAVVAQPAPEDPPALAATHDGASATAADSADVTKATADSTTTSIHDRRPSKSRKSVRFTAEDEPTHEHDPSFESRVKHEHDFEKKVVNHEVDTLEDSEDRSSPPLEGPILVVTPPTQPSFEASQLAEENAKLTEQIQLMTKLLAEYEASYAKSDDSIRQAKETMAAQTSELERLKNVAEVKEDLLRQTELEFLDERKGLLEEIAKQQAIAASWEEKLKAETQAWQNLMGQGKQALAALTSQRDAALAQVQELQQQLASVQEQLNSAPSAESSEQLVELTAQLDQALKERDSAVNSKQALLEYGKAQLVSKEGEIASLKEKIDSVAAEQAAASDQLKGLQDQLQSQSSRAEDLQNQLTAASEAHARQLADRDETIALKERELASLRQQLSERLLEQDKQLQATRAPSDQMDQEDEKEAPPVPLRVKITSPEETDRELAPPAPAGDVDQEAKLAEKERQIVELTEKIRTLEMQLSAKNDEERKFSDLELRVKALEEERLSLGRTIEDLELERDTIRASQLSAAENERRAFQLQTSAVRDKETSESRAHRLATELEQRTAELAEALRKLHAVERLLETNKELLTEEALARRRVTQQYEEAKQVITQMAETSTKDKLAIRTAWSKRLKMVERHLVLKQDEVKRLKGELERNIGGHSMRWVVIMGFLLFLYSLRHWDPTTSPY